MHYLKEHKKAKYIILMMNNNEEHLYHIDAECKRQFNWLMKQYIYKENITEKLKVYNQML